MMGIPDILTRFVPTFDTLFLGVKDTDTNDLTKTEHPLGWLLKVLQQEDVDDPKVMREVIQETLVYFDTLEPAHAAQHKNAMIYLFHLVLFRRPVDEREELIELLKAHAQDKEVENIIMTGAEALIEQGIGQGRIDAKQADVIKLLLRRFPHLPEAVTNEIGEIQDLIRLDSFFEQILAAHSLDDIDISNKS